MLLALITAAAPASAQGVQLPPITVGAGLQTSFVHTDADAEEEEDDASDAFSLNSARLYVSGPVTSTIKFMFNTEYNGADQRRRRSSTPSRSSSSRRGFNIWFGRFLPPSDRANLYGPYYAHHWSVYTDGVQDGYPFIFQGRDNGAVVLGPVRQGEAVGRRVRRRVGDRRRHAARRRPHPGGLLGSRAGLLPERHLLRRQEHPGHRRRRPGAGLRTSRPTTSTSCSSGRSARAAP